MAKLKESDLRAKGAIGGVARLGPDTARRLIGERDSYKAELDRVSPPW